jgi:uncharacterized protein YoxC
MVIEILLVILILTATALCLFVIVSLKKMNQQIEQLQKDVKQVVEKTIPVLNNINEVTIRVNRVVSEVEDYWDEIDHSIRKIKDKVSNFTSLKLLSDVESPTVDFIKNLKALSKGVSAFWREFRRK